MDELIPESSSIIKNYIAFYTVLENDIESNTLKVKVKNKMIPAHLKEKFFNEFNKKAIDMSITEEEIDSFLNKNEK